MLEQYAELLGVLSGTIGIIMSLAYFPQAYKIIKRKSSADISLMTFSTFWLGVLIWFFYGLSINNFPLIIANSVGILGTTTVLIVCLKYRK